MTQTTLCFYFAIYYIHVGITKKKSLTNALFFWCYKFNLFIYAYHYNNAFDFQSVADWKGNFTCLQLK